MDAVKNETKNEIDNIECLHGYVLIQPTNDNSTGGIIHPDSLGVTSSKGTVISVGTGTPDGNGQIIPMKVQPGDSVYFIKNKREEVRVDGKDYYFIDQLAVMGVIQNV